MYLSDEDQMREYYRQNENAYWKGVLATAKAESRAEGRAEGILKVQHFTKLTDEEMASL